MAPVSVGRRLRLADVSGRLAPQIGASIGAMEHKLDPPLTTLMVGLGVPLSFLTLPLWWQALQGV